MASTDLVGSVGDLLGRAENTKQRTVEKELGKDAFLKLLVTQLKHQDPMKPMDDTAFIGEMAQFSSLEQMQNMNKLLEAQQTFGALSQASGMIGKYVTIQIPGEQAQIVKGKVEEVRSMAGQINVVIDGKPYNAVDIRQVSDQPTK